MQVPQFSPRISLIEMAPRATPHSGCLGHPALPCLSPAPQGTGSDWKKFLGNAQFVSTQMDTMFAFIYKIIIIVHVGVVKTCVVIIMEAQEKERQKIE
jgi:hypothetical protein